MKKLLIGLLALASFSTFAGIPDLLIVKNACFKIKSYRVETKCYQEAIDSMVAGSTPVQFANRMCGMGPKKEDIVNCLDSVVRDLDLSELDRASIICRDDSGEADEAECLQNAFQEINK